MEIIIFVAGFIAAATAAGGIIFVWAVLTGRLKKPGGGDARDS